jgi:hypothetical protein
MGQFKHTMVSGDEQILWACALESNGHSIAMKLCGKFYTSRQRLEGCTVSMESSCYADTSTRPLPLYHSLKTSRLQRQNTQ